MLGVNKAILCGTLGKDPETRYTSSGKAVTSFSIATSERWKDQSGEKQERTEWHNITAFDKLAEICGEYLKKGTVVYVEGKIKTEKYTAKDGVEKSATKIVIDTMQMIGGGERSETRQRSAQSSPAASRPERQSQPSKPSVSRESDFDDDIPFN